MDNRGDLTGFHRLVHLDLKGAPPKIAYYEKLFPLLKIWGATGVLIEYEDTFPYSGRFLEIRSTESYSHQDMERICKLAKSHDLAMIPLVQTFGHLEFVLKHKRFRSCRETKAFPNSICPSQEESKEIVQEMIDQIVQFHSGIKWLHIGADEVWNLGVCQRCQRRMLENNWTKDRLFLQHVVDIAKYIRSTYPHITPIVWDDMFRFTDIQVLKDSSIQNLVEPMVWTYRSNDINLPKGIWDTLSSIFDCLWIASAFKGATGVHQMIPDINHHIRNHMLWLDELPMISEKFKCFRGWALTGWQRYDHFSVLCELLPVGIPSLVVCLQTIQNETFDDTILANTSKLLGSVQPIDLSIFPRPRDLQEHLDFPGKELFRAVQLLANHKARYEAFLNSDRMQGWFSKYHIMHNVCNLLHIEPLLTEARILQGLFLSLKLELEGTLNDHFFPKSVDEWLTENINSEMTHLAEVIARLDDLMKYEENEMEV